MSNEQEQADFALEQPLTPAVLFWAVSDPTRRKMLETLARNGPTSVADLLGQFPMSGPAMSRHLGCLEGGGLITRERKDRHQICTAKFDNVLRARQWLNALISISSTSEVGRGTEQRA